MSDTMPVSADFPTMGSSWPEHVINVSGSSASGTRQATRPGKSTAADPKGAPRSPVLIRNGNGPKPITVKRMWAGNVAEASATSRNVRIIPRSGNSFAGGRADGS